MSTKHKIANAAVIITITAVLSKVLGFVREMVIAAKFGTSIKTDAFLIALAVPEFFTDILAGGALTAAFIPVFSHYLAKNDYREASKIFSTIFNLLTVSLLAIIILGILNAGRILGFIAPGFSEEVLNLSVRISYIIFPAMLFMGLASYLGGVLNADKHFLLPSLQQAILNVVIIFSVVFLAAKWDIRSLAIGFIAGGVIQFVVLIPPVLKRKFKYTLCFFVKHQGIKEIKSMWVPLLAALAISNVVSIIVKMFASTLPEGSISALHFAYRLKQLPVVIFGVTLATAIFPYISWQAAEGNTVDFKRSITRAFKVIFFLTFPLCLGMAVFKVPVVRVFFERGSFTQTSTQLTAAALLCYLPGAIAVSLTFVAMRAYYALKDPVTPLKAAVSGLAVMIIAGWVLKNAYSHRGLAMAQSLAEISIFLFLLFYLVYKIRVLELYSLLVSFGRVIAVSLAAIVPSHYLFGYLRRYSDTELLPLAAATAVAGGMFIVLILLFNIEEGRFFIKTVKEKFNI